MMTPHELAHHSRRTVSRFSATAIVAVSILAAAGPRQLVGQAPVDAEAQKIFQTALDKRMERWAAVDDYTLVQSMNGAEITLYYEKTTVDGMPAFRHVPPGEYEKREFDEAGLGGGMSGLGGGGAAGGLPSPGASREGSSGMPSPGSMPSSGGLPGGAGAGGMPGGLPMPKLPGLSKLQDKMPAMPGAPGSGSGNRLQDAAGGMLGGAIGAATGGLQQRLTQKGMEGLMSLAAGKQDDGSDDARIEQMMFRELGRRTRLQGTETLDGVEAFVLVADNMQDLDLGAPTGEDTKFTLRTMTVWLDKSEYVPLRSTMDGDLDLNGKSQPVRIEIVEQDYRRIETMYQPFRRVMRFEGIMEAMHAANPKEMKKLEKELAELEKAKKKMAQIPEAQRRMIEAQTGRSMESQIDQAAERLRQIAGGDMSEMSEMVTEVAELRVNEGPPTKYGRGDVTVAGDVALTVPHTVVSVASGANPTDGTTLSMIQLMGGIEGEALAIVQLNIAGPYPEAGTTTAADAAAFLGLPGDHEVGLTTEHGGATVTITSRAGDRIRGEYSFEGSGDMPAVDGRARKVTATVAGTFDAPIPPAMPQVPGMMSGASP